MIPIDRADGHGASTAKDRNNTLLKRMSVGVKKPLVPCTMLDVEKPVPTVTATNSNPIRVAAAVPAMRKKLSQPWSIGKQCSPLAAFVYYKLREPEVIGSSVAFVQNALVMSQGKRNPRVVGNAEVIPTLRNGLAQRTSWKTVLGNLLVLTALGSGNLPITRFFRHCGEFLPISPSSAYDQQ
jgi:hypothetical protein